MNARLVKADEHWRLRDHSTAQPIPSHELAVDEVYDSVPPCIK
jgi:hypothetical protein